MFLLQHVKIMNHKVLKNVDLCFCNDSQRFPSEIYKSVIIGPNGVGKSILLRTIVDIFEYLFNCQNYPNVNKYLPYSFLVEYRIDNDDYSATNYDMTMYNGRIIYRRPLYKRNATEISIDELLLPNKIIASTMTITDKFSTRSTELYQYRGARNDRSQTTSTRAVVRRTVEGIMDGINTKNDFRKELEDLLAYLNLKREMYVTYNTKYKDIFFTPDMTPNKLQDIFDNWEKYFTRSTPPWGLTHFGSIRKNEENLRLLADFLVRQAEEMNMQNQTYLSYNIFGDDSIGHDKKAIGLLSQLDILTYPTLHVKKEDVYRFEESSSGESQLLCLFIGILSSIRSDSLVIIDEPENSCHPEWQMKFIDWLKELFANYNSCHFIIATHSPSILMNLKPEVSTILPIKRTQDGIVINEESEADNTFSWRYEDLLTYTMNMPSVRTELFDKYMNLFEQAIQNKNAQAAKKYYDLLVAMMRPDDVLREILQIKRVGLL